MSYRSCFRWVFGHPSFSFHQNSLSIYKISKARTVWPLGHGRGFPSSGGAPRCHVPCRRGSCTPSSCLANGRYGNTSMSYGDKKRRTEWRRLTWWSVFACRDRMRAIFVCMKRSQALCDRFFLLLLVSGVSTVALIALLLVLLLAADVVPAAALEPPGRVLVPVLASYCALELAARRPAASWTGASYLEGSSTVV